MDWYKRFPTPYRADTWSLTLAEHGAYNLLLDHYYTTERPLPNEDRALAAICGCGLDEWFLVKENVTRYFTVTEASLTHDKCDTVIDEALGSRNGNRDRQKAFRKRLKEQKSITRDVTDDNALVTLLEERRGDKKESPTVVSPRGSRLSGQWQPSPEDRQYAVDRQVDPDLAAEEFRNYWTSATGKTAIKSDWSKTFHNSILALQERGKFRLVKADPKRTGMFAQ